MSVILEICANSVTSALHAARGGAQRIELCDNLWEGGTTPSAGTLLQVRKLTTLEVFVLVRPRGGDFVYSDTEFQTMCADIEFLKQAGAHGVVAGVLMPDGRVDVVRTRQLVELAHPLPFVFHRAFDLCPDPFSALMDIIGTGAGRLLTSGQKSKAIDGMELILGLHEAARGRLEILPGGGLQKESMAEFIRKTPIRQFHFTAKMPVPIQHGHGPRISMNGSPAISEEVYFQSDETIIRTTFQHLHDLQ